MIDVVDRIDGQTDVVQRGALVVVVGTVAQRIF